jgi:Leucine-rich repeat (LRR) protein
MSFSLANILRFSTPARRVLLVLVLMLSVLVPAFAQKSKTGKSTKKQTTQPAKTEKKPEKARVQSEEEERVKGIITFLQYVLNTLGSSSTPSRDKDVLITESFAKIFRDEKVQIEDDLDDERMVITNKDVVAYLKDVDFFFQDAKFEFNVDEIKSSSLSNGDLFYKVTLRRILTGTTADGRKVNSNIPRFVEINYDPDAQDLKIVSIYTNEFDEKAALTEWWSTLSDEWQQIFRRRLNLKDSVGINDIKNITAIEELDLGSNRYILDVEPLTQLPALKLLNLSATNITDLTPIRNLTGLVELNLQNTKVADLSSLRYASKLARLNISYTMVRDIAMMEKLQSLQNLEMGGVGVMDFTPLQHLTALTNLDISSTQLSTLKEIKLPPTLTALNLRGTPVKELTGIEVLSNLESLEIDSTRIRDLSPLASLAKLSVLQANYTFVDDLSPLEKLQSLERVYCDQTSITRDKADAFIAARPDVLVIFNSKDLRVWWDGLDKVWKSLLSKTAGVRDNPSNEELAVVTSLDSINVANSSVVNLQPLKKLLKLKYIHAANTAVTDLTPFSSHRDLEYIDISNTAVNDVSVIGKFSKLKTLKMNRIGGASLVAISGLKDLKVVYADDNALDDIAARQFLESNPATLLIYKTKRLRTWWESLSPDWKEVMASTGDTLSTPENLHRMVEAETLTVRDASVNEMNSLGEFVRLKSLKFSGTAINEIVPVENLTETITTLHITNSPLQDLSPVSKFRFLQDLDISSTPADELKPLASLAALKKLNCAGTQVKKLDPLESLSELEYLDCSNTRVTNLEPIFDLPLKQLKCFNTKISSREVDKFREENRDANVVYYR